MTISLIIVTIVLETQARDQLNDAFAATSIIGFWMITVLATITVLCSIIQIRKVVKRLKFVVPYQTFTLAFFGVLAAQIIVTTIAFGYTAVWYGRYVFSEYYEPESASYSAY